MTLFNVMPISSLLRHGKLFYASGIIMMWWLIDVMVSVSAVCCPVWSQCVPWACPQLLGLVTVVTVNTQTPGTMIPMWHDDTNVSDIRDNSDNMGSSLSAEVLELIDNRLEYQVTFEISLHTWSSFVSTETILGYKIRSCWTICPISHPSVYHSKRGLRWHKHNTCSNNPY